jgi:hypothetical protein
MPLSRQTRRCRVLDAVGPISLIPGDHKSILRPLYQPRWSLYGLEPWLALLPLALKRVKYLLTIIKRSISKVWSLESAVTVVQRVKHHRFLKQCFFHSICFCDSFPAEIIAVVEDGSLMVLLTLAKDDTSLLKLRLIVSEIHSDLL